VDGIRSDVGTTAQVLLVDLLGDAGMALAPRYGVEATPTFLLFERGGALVETVRLDRAWIVSRLRALAP